MIIGSGPRREGPPIASRHSDVAGVGLKPEKPSRVERSTGLVLSSQSIAARPFSAAEAAAKRIRQLHLCAVTEISPMLRWLVLV
jgi:hypothetical protein